MTLLRAQLEANPCQTIEEMSNALNQPWLTIQAHLQQISKTNRAGVWVLHNLPEENRAHRSATCTLLLQRYNTEPFFDRLITADEKWIMYDNPNAKDSGSHQINSPEGLLSQDEVEKLAYQLNEEAERTERPIRRLSKVMYGSTCADMQVDVMGECLSSIKHVVGHRFTTLETISNYRNSYPGFSSGRPRGTTPADDRYIVLQARRNRRLTAGEIARHRRLDDRYRVLPWPEDCTVVVCLHDALYGVPLTPAHRRRRSLWCREHRNRRYSEWG
ncbi:histone-lysine N-methyltransferase SETMAR [Trichonephila clavipes]|nr:histone-lysine N-methyltransferase SETMAR [Trichonephila clavipes]